MCDYFICRCLLIKSLEYNHLAAKYVKQDFICAVICTIATIVIYATLVGVNVIYGINRYRLPITFYVIFLPFERFSLNWWINFAFQTASIFINALLIFPYIVLNTTLLNEACLEIDIATHDTLKLNLVLNDAHPGALMLGRSLMKKKMEKVLNRTLEMLEWNSKIQSLMQLIFAAEFSLLSFLFSMCLYVIESDVLGSFFNICVISLSLSQLFMYCWIGTRIHSKVQKLAAAIYEVNWDLMTVRQRKNFLLILMNVQNVKHLNGVFYELSLKTFQKVRRSVWHYMIFRQFFSQHRSWISHTACTLCSSQPTKSEALIGMKY